MPTLRKPPDVTLQKSHGTGGSSEYRVTYATAVTALSLGNLLRGYAEQVQNAGWNAYPATIGDFGAVQSFEMPDSHGHHWRGLLAVVDSGADRAVLFRVHPAVP